LHKAGFKVRYTAQHVLNINNRKLYTRDTLCITSQVISTYLAWLSLAVWFRTSLQVTSTNSVISDTLS